MTASASNLESTLNTNSLKIAGAGGALRLPTEAEKNLIRYQDGDTLGAFLPTSGMERVAAARKAGTLDINGILQQRTATAISGGTPEPPVVPLLQQIPKTSGTPQSSFIKQSKRSLGKIKRPRAKRGNRAALLSDSDEPRLG